MVRHVVIWRFKDEYDEAQKQEIRAKVKQGLERLAGVVDGVRELTVIAQPLPTSDGDAMLDSLFDSPEALAAYQKHPEHLKMREYIHSVLDSRKCVDYTV